MYGVVLRWVVLSWIVLSLKELCWVLPQLNGFFSNGRPRMTTCGQNMTYDNIYIYSKRPWCVLFGKMTHFDHRLNFWHDFQNVPEPFPATHSFWSEGRHLSIFWGPEAVTSQGSLLSVLWELGSWNIFWEIAMVLLMTRYKFGFDPMHVRICTKCQVRPYLSYVELYGVESCMEMYCVELYWDVLYWVELYWVVLYWVELYCIEPSCIELYCIELSLSSCIVLSRVVSSCVDFIWVTSGKKCLRIRILSLRNLSE